MKGKNYTMWDGARGTVVVILSFVWNPQFWKLANPW